MATRPMGYRGGKVASNALQDEIRRLQPPSGSSPEYLVLWHQIVGDFPPEHFQESDRGVLENYVTNLERLKQAEAELKGQPLVIEDRLGTPKENPLLKTVDKLSRTVLSQARSLRLVPASRMVNTQMPKQSEHRRRQGEEATAAKRPGGIRLAS